MTQSSDSSAAFSVSSLQASAAVQALHVCLGGEAPIVVGRAQPRTDDEQRHGEQREHEQRAGDAEPRVVGDGVGEVELRDVDPVLLRQLDEDPQPGRREHPEARRDPRRVVAQRDDRVDDEEELERVGEQQQHRPRLEQLEGQHADQPVVEEELADPDRGEVGPVAQRRDVGDREVVDVERLVGALVGPVGSEVDVRERAQQRVVDRVEDERGEDHERKARDQQRHEQPREDDRARSAPARPWRVRRP